MKTRLISIACMLPFLIFLILGKTPLMILCMLVSAAAMYEFYKGFENLEIKSSKPVAFALLLILYVIIFASLIRAKSWDLYEILVDAWVYLVIGASLLLIILDKNHNILGPTYTLLGVFYLGFTFAHVALLEQRVHALAWLPIIIAYMSDTGGYLGGRYFGKHRLAPALSPKKTVEGSACGILLGTIGALVFSLICFRDHVLFCIILGVIGSVFAELGDLTASAFKRKMGIKDYSNLIPGHGGVLDRIDSITFVAPLVYICTVIFIL